MRQLGRAAWSVEVRARAGVVALLLSTGMTIAPGVAHAAVMEGVLSEVAGDPGTFTLAAAGRDLLLSGDVPTMPASGARVRVSGRVHGSTMTLDAQPQVLEAAPTSIELGPRTVLVLPIDLGDNMPEVPAFLRKTVFDDPYSAAGFFAEASFGRTTLIGIADTRGDVAAPTRSLADGSTCDYWGWGTDAREQAQAAGWNVDAYDHVIHYWSQRTECRFGGLGQLNGRYTWINGGLTPFVFDHEIGHNLGLHHANGYRCVDASGQPVALSDTCTSQEYLDPFDTMGSKAVHFQGFHKAKLGWIAASGVTQVTATGTYTLDAATSASTGVQLLEIPSSRKGGRVDPLYVDYRRPGGLYEVFLPTDPVVNGATVRIAAGLGVLGRTHLIDMEPATAAYTDAPLAVGRSFTDASRGIRIDTLAANERSLTVRVTVGVV